MKLDIPRVRPAMILSCSTPQDARQLHCFGTLCQHVLGLLDFSRVSEIGIKPSAQQVWTGPMFAVRTAMAPCDGR